MGGLGQDGGYSIPLSDGSVMWSFGDTLLGARREGYDDTSMYLDDWLHNNDYAKSSVKMIANTAGITRDPIHLHPDAIEYITAYGKVGEVIPVDDGRRHASGRYRPYWPMDGICIDGRLYMFYIMVDCGSAPEPGIVDINVFGTGVAVAEKPWREFSRLEANVPVLLPNDPVSKLESRFLFWNNEALSKGVSVPDFGVAVLKRIVSGHVYAYGSRVRIRNKSVRHEVCVARVPYSSIGDLKAWRYWNGRTWGQDSTDCATLFTGNSNELSVSWNEYLGQYVSFYGYAGENYLVGTRQRGAMSELHMRHSPSPEGPWSDPVKVYDLRLSLPGDYCYAGKEHPEYQEKDGKRTWVTFVSHQRYFPELLCIDFE